jgi:hypothetical protein
MLKLLFVFPLILIAGLVGFGMILPLLALLPLALAFGGVVLALVIGFGIFGIVLRLVAGLLVGVSTLFVCALGFGFVVAGGAIVLALGVFVGHLLLPLLVVAAVIWLIRRHARPVAPVLRPPAASS